VVVSVRGTAVMAAVSAGRVLECAPPVSPVVSPKRGPTHSSAAEAALWDPRRYRRLGSVKERKGGRCPSSLRRSQRAAQYS